jgi:hypothetical protein
MKSGELAIAMALMTSAPLQAAVALGPTGNAYEFVAASGISWDEADTAARSATYLGVAGHLATIFTASENDFVLGLLSNIDGSVWLGGSDAQEEGTRQWVTGERFWAGDSNGNAGPDAFYANWDRIYGAEPNSAGGGEDYLTIFGLRSPSDPELVAGYWNDLSPETMASSGIYQIKGYVIEYEAAAIPLPSMLALLGIGLAAFGVIRPSKLVA